MVMWTLGVLAGLFCLDRLLLRAEARGWIYYRRSKPSRGASAYHLLEMSSILDPTFNVVIEQRVSEERQEDEAGDPER